MSWYKDKDQVRNYIRSRARVFISGHEHDPKVSVDNVEQGCDVLMLAAGATAPFHSDEVYTFTYNIIEFDWDEEIDGLSVTIHPRAWNPQRTCFENDDTRLGGSNPSYHLNSPNFRNSPRLSTSAIAPTITKDAHAARLTPVPEIAMPEPSNGISQPVPLNNEEGYETARLRFFRDLYEVERLQILVERGALSEKFNERMTQGVERRLFDMLARDGKLDGIEAMINTLITERKNRKSNG